MALYAYKCGRPTPEVDKITIHHGQEEIGVPGKVRWKPIEITFYEIIEDMDTVANYLNFWHQKSMIDVENSAQRPPAEYRLTCQLAMLDGAGKPVWNYNMYECWPSTVGPCELSYTDSDLAEITVTLELSKVIESKDTDI